MMKQTLLPVVPGTTGNNVCFIINQVPQPWHGQGCFVHEAALAVKEADRARCEWWPHVLGRMLKHDSYGKVDTRYIIFIYYVYTVILLYNDFRILLGAVSTAYYRTIYMILYYLLGIPALKRVSLITHHRRDRSKRNTYKLYVIP